MKLPVRAGKTPQTDALRGGSRVATAGSGGDKPRTLLPEERRLIIFLATVVTIGLAFPFPITKHILMAVLGVFVLLIFLKDLRLAMCLLPILIPLQTLVPKDFIPIPGVNLETILMVLTFVSWRLQRGGFPPRRPEHAMPKFVWVFVAFLVWLTLAALRTAFDARIDLGELFAVYKNQWIYVAILFIVADSLRDERDRMRMMVAVCIGVILVSIQPIWRGTETMALGKQLVRHRAVSLMAMQPNIYGGALACFAPFPLIYFAKGIGGKKGRILFAIASGVATYALVLTLSRGSWLAFGTAVAVVGLLFERRVLYILALGALLSPYWVPEDAMNRGETLSQIDVESDNLDDDEGSAFVRLDQWRALPDMLADSPVIGHGFMSYPQLYRRFGSLGRRKAAHVGYAEYSAEMGVPGLALYVGVFVTMGIFGLVLARKGTSLFSRVHGIGLLAAAIAMLVAECFGSRFKIGNVTAFLWIYAGVAIAAWRWPANGPAEMQEPTAPAENRRLVGRLSRGRLAARRSS